MLQISSNVAIADSELEITAIRAQGPGGQKVNKVSTALQLRFDISASSLPQLYKQRLLALSDQRITKQGVIVIKAQKFRSQERNREELLERLRQLIVGAVKVQKRRHLTKPTRSSQRKRMDSKSARGKQKNLRGRVDY